MLIIRLETQVNKQKRGLLVKINIIKIYIKKN